MEEFRQLKKLLLELVYLKDKHDEGYCLHLLQEKLDVISQKRAFLTSEEDTKYKKEFRNYEDLLQILHQCVFGKYVYDKPRGYPGDFVTQEMIILGRKEPVHRYLGTTPLGQLLGALTYDMEACAANEFRLKFIKEQISHSGISIASIGSGSGIEFWDMEEAFLKSSRILLLDMDEGAHESARKHICTASGIEYHLANLLKFILSNQKNEVLASRDLIYMLGLLDYFSVKHSAKIVSRLWENVNAGGKFILTNAHETNPTRLWMEYVSEWYLNYKTKDEMFQIIEELEHVKNIEYQIDEFLVYQYIIITKN